MSKTDAYTELSGFRDCLDERAIANGKWPRGNHCAPCVCASLPEPGFNDISMKRNEIAVQMVDAEDRTHADSGFEVLSRSRRRAAVALWRAKEPRRTQRKRWRLHLIAVNCSKLHLKK